MRNVRISIFIITLILICIGIVMIYSSSGIYAYEKLHDSDYFLKRHIFYLFLGFLATILVLSIDYHYLQRLAKPLLIFSLFLLILVLIPGIGREVAGAKRWFRFFGFSFQPSKLAGLCLIIYIADFLARKKEKIGNFFEGFLPVMLVLGFCVGLIILQPDLGTAMALVMVAMLMLFVGEIKLLHIFIIFVFSLPLFYYLIVKVPYRYARILAFLNPWQDPKGIGFQIIQSQIALGSGGLLGVGLGQSKQKLFFLPAAHTDFIFSIIGEELGLIGAMTVLILFFLFIYQGFKIVKNAPDIFSQMLSLGIISLLGLEAVINIGVTIAAFPTKGLPLPFISYGGSSLVLDMIGVGLLLNIARGK